MLRSVQVFPRRSEFIRVRRRALRRAGMPGSEPPDRVLRCSGASSGCERGERRLRDDVAPLLHEVPGLRQLEWCTAAADDPRERVHRWRGNHRILHADRHERIA